MVFGVGMGFRGEDGQPPPGEKMAKKMATARAGLAIS